MDPVTTRLPDVQKKIQELLPANAILCGQSLGGDLRAIKVQEKVIVIIKFRCRYSKIKIRICGYEDLKKPCSDVSLIESIEALIIFRLGEIKKD